MIRVLRALAMVPFFLAYAALSFVAWILIRLGKLLFVDAILALSETSRLTDAVEAMVAFLAYCRCPRCGWAAGRLVQQVIGDGVPAAIQVLEAGPVRQSLLLDGWLGCRAVVAIEHVKELGGDPVEVTGNLFEAMELLEARDFGPDAHAHVLLPSKKVESN